VGLFVVVGGAGCNERAGIRELEPDRELRPTPKAPETAEVAVSSLFTDEGLDRALTALTRAARQGAGEAAIAALELRITESTLELQASDPNRSDRVLSWKYKGGKLEGPVVVELRGAGKLKENLFPLEAVYLKAIPRLSALAVEHVDPQDGKVDSIVVRRNFPFSRDVRFRVFVESPRRNGQLDANRFGHPLLG